MGKCIKGSGNIINVTAKVKIALILNLNIGEFIWPDGKKFLGNFKNDKRDGKGEIQLPIDIKCINEWQNDKIVQQGKLVSVEDANPKES